MFDRFVWAALFFALGALALALAYSVWFAPEAFDDLTDKAISSNDALYICTPDGTTTSPICPIDTSGRNEDIFVSADLAQGSVAWQKLRLVNTGAHPWDVLTVTPIWIEVSDPRRTCEILPEGRGFRANLDTARTGGEAIYGTGQASMITVLGTLGTGGKSEPSQSTRYPINSNDNHGSVARTDQNGTWIYSHISGLYYNTIHVEPRDYEDVLLGIGLNSETPPECLDVTWKLEVFWETQIHNP